MSKFNWMAIGKVGKWTDKNDQTVNIDEEYLDQIVANTNPENVKFVIEHPKYNKIGFGKTSALKRVGELLFALPKEVNEDFKNAVNSGELPGRSMTIHKATKKLLDISFLPPEIAPAIDGLGAYSFSGSMKDDNLEVFILQAPLPNNESHFAHLVSDSPERSEIKSTENGTRIEFAQYEMSSWPFRTIRDLFRNIKDFLISKYDLDTANQILPNYSIDEVGNPPTIWENPTLPYVTNSFSKNKQEDKMDLSKIDLSKVNPDIKAAIEKLQADNQKLQTEKDEATVQLQAATTKLTKAEEEKIGAEILQFCNSEKIAKKILPADQKKAVRFLMAQKEKAVLEFSASDGKKENFDAYEFAKALIEKLPDAIDTNELAKGSNTAEPDNLSEAQKTGKTMASFVNKKNDQ